MIMNKIFKISSMLLAGALALVSCKQEPVLRLTDVGPEMKVISYTEATYMGAGIKFSVDINDNDFALSTLKAALYYDESAVAGLTIRTKENGTYEGVIPAPLYKDIPDGVASVVFAAQNVGMGLTYDTVYVSLTRPNFDTVNLVDENGQAYAMAKTGDYAYELEGTFPALFKAKVVTPAINDEGEVVTFGYDGNYLSTSKTDYVPFSAGVPGKFKITVDLKTLKAGPLGSGDVVSTMEFKQGQTMDFGGIVDFNNWTLDYDYFVVNEDFTAATFRAVDGLYRMDYDTKKMNIKVEPMANENDVLTLSADGSGAPWMIGSGIGKPAIGPSWNTTDGAYPMAQVADKIYQFTLTCPGQLASGADFKIFHQKGWGGEFTTSNYAEINLAPAFEMDPSSGNIKGKDIIPGKSYKLILDLTGGVNAAKISYEEVVIPSNTLDIKVNGVNALKVSNTIYKVSAVEVAQNSMITFEGDAIGNPLEWYVDPDHFAVTAEGLQFKAVTGFYSFELNLEEKFVTVRRVKDNGKPATYVDDGAITFMGWGVGHPYIASPLAWDGGHLITLAEIEDGVYQFTGVAGEGTDKTMGVRWQYDAELSFKFFGQAGWGVEWGTVTLTDEAKKWLFVDGNVELIVKEVKEDGTKVRQPLELGATYVMTVTDCTPADGNGKFNCTIDFAKK
jgi:hypothetical protein